MCISLPHLHVGTASFPPVLQSNQHTENSADSTRLSAEDYDLRAANKACMMLIYQKWCFAALSPNIFSPCTKCLPGCALNMLSKHPLPSYPLRRGIEKISELWKAFGKGLVASCSPTASLIPPYPSADPLMCNIHVQDFPWSSEIPHGVNPQPSNPSGATRLHHRQRC